MLGNLINVMRKYSVAIAIVIFTCNGCSVLTSLNSSDKIKKIYTVTDPNGYRIVSKLPKDGMDYPVFRKKSGAIINNGIYDQINASGYAAKTGDIILRLKDTTFSFGVAVANLGGYSHAGVILTDNHQVFVVDVHPVRTEFTKILLRDWISDGISKKGKRVNTIHIKILRIKDFNIDNLLRLKGHIKELIGKPYEFSITDRKDCAEFVLQLIKPYIKKEMPYNMNKLIMKIQRSLLDEIKKIMATNTELKTELSEYYRMLENNYKYFVKRLPPSMVTPSTFEWSSELQTLHYFYSNKINRYKDILKFYNSALRSITAFHAINGVAMAIPEKQLNRIFHSYGIDYRTVNRMIRVVRQHTKNGENQKYFDSQKLIQSFIWAYAEEKDTYNNILKGFTHVKK